MRFAIVPAIGLGMLVCDARALDLAGYAAGEEFTMSHRAEFTRRPGNLCAEKACFGKKNLGDFEATVSVMLDDDMRVWMVLVYFPWRIAFMVRQSAIDKYGTPTSESTSTGQNAFGAKFPVRSLDWEVPDGRISFSDRCGAIDSGCLTMTSKNSKFEGPGPKLKL